MLIIFFDIDGIVHKEFVLVGQIVNSSNYCDVLWLLRENVRRPRPELWRQKNWLLITTKQNLVLPFSSGNFLPKPT
jgi:hypothetical protein